jgi:hypothetical protein
MTEKVVGFLLAFILVESAFHFLRTVAWFNFINDHV